MENIYTVYISVEKEAEEVKVAAAGSVSCLQPRLLLLNEKEEEKNSE